MRPVLAVDFLRVFFSLLLAKIQLWWYRLSTAVKSIVVLYKLPDQTIESFLKSYEMFEHDAVTEDTEYEDHTISYYTVLNHLCAIGEVEKMYIPPLIDETVGVFDNQMLFEQKMAADLELPPNSKILDVGCGRGRVAAHVSRLTGAHVYGINIDRTQIENAQNNATLTGLPHKLTFSVNNFNDPLPFPDEHFDGLYQVQVLTYAKDKEALFAEMFRVLKPGAKLSFLDWVKLPAYDDDNAHHRHLISRVKPLIGAVDTPSPEELSTTLEKVGFKVTFSGDASVSGHQAELIVKADTFFTILNKMINTLVAIKILPKHFKTLFDRLTKDGDAFIEADRLGIFTTSYQTIAQKPLKA